MDGLYPRALFESMPYIHEAGRDFVTIPYHFGISNSGYMVRVIIISNSTTVNIPALGYEEEHSAGSFYEFEFFNTPHGTAVRCSRPCITVQYAKESQTADSTPWILPFMVVLTPVGHYSTNATFSTPSWAGSLADIALSLVVDFFPVEDLYLDGNSTESLDWYVAPQNLGAYATVTVQPGQHSLYTIDPEHR